MRAQGLTPASQMLDIGEVPADEKLAGLLGIGIGERVLRIERLRLASGDPMAIETTHLSVRRFPGLRRSLATCPSLYTVLGEVCGVHLAEADETIETSLSTPREAQLLGTDVGLPMLLLSRHSRDAQGRPVEWVRSVYRGSRYKFVAALHRPGSPVLRRGTAPRDRGRPRPHLRRADGACLGSRADDRGAPSGARRVRAACPSGPGGRLGGRFVRRVQRDAEAGRATAADAGAGAPSGPPAADARR